MVDSWSKGEAAVSYGLVADLGKRGACLGINVTDLNDTFTGKYCVAQIHFPLPTLVPPDELVQLRLNVSNTNLAGTIYEYYANFTSFFYHDTFSFALCAPSTCSYQEINDILGYGECSWRFQ